MPFLKCHFVPNLIITGPLILEDRNLDINVRKQKADYQKSSDELAAHVSENNQLVKV
jgi:hypothetical protein